MAAQIKIAPHFIEVRRLTTHSTGARVSLIFIVNLNLSALCARPVNSGIICTAPLMREA